MVEKVPPLHAIVAALQEGVSQEENYRLLFDRFYEPLLHFFSRHGRNPDECLDLIQETFLGIYRGIATFRGDAKFETWLFNIAANAERKTWRWKAAVKRMATEVSLDAADPETGRMEVGETLASSAPGPDEDALSRERSRHFNQAVAELPGQMRKCLLLRIRQGLKYHEIGAVMRLSLGTVKRLLFEARNRLQGELGHDVATLLPGGDEAES
jgi:RNA polymerase sigma-70 factor (ECF subfamily)